MALITEDHLEQQCLEWFKELGYAYAFAPNLAPDGTSPERTDFRQVILTGHLRSALQRLNLGVPASTIESALLQLANPNVPGLLASNRNFHRWMTQGLPITTMDGDQQVGIRLKVIGFDDPASNDWLVVNQPLFLHKSSRSLIAPSKSPSPTNISSAPKPERSERRRVTSPRARRPTSPALPRSKQTAHASTQESSRLYFV